MLISEGLKGCGGVLLVYMFFGSSLGKTKRCLISALSDI